MENIRLFMAAELPENFQYDLENFITKLKRPNINAVRWIPIANIHLTLKFLGEPHKTRIGGLSQLLKSVTANFKQFNIKITNIGAFPGISQPRVIWLGVEAPKELYRLQKYIKNETNNLGFKTDKRPFSPHLTIGRIKRNAPTRDVRKVSEVLSTTKMAINDSISIDTIILFQSELRPQGAEYTPLITARLE